DRVYAALGEVGHWWDPSHTFSRDAANLSMELRAGGCFCERLKDGGSVQHLQVVYAAPGQGLRLRGALGPLRTEGVDGALSWRLKAGEGGTSVTLSYVLGGYIRSGMEQWAPEVDRVLAEEPEPGIFRAANAKYRCEDMDRDGSMPSSATVPMSRSRHQESGTAGCLRSRRQRLGTGIGTRSRTAGSACFCRCRARHRRRPSQSCSGWRNSACPPRSFSTGSAPPSRYCTRCGSRSGPQRPGQACRSI